MAEFVETGVIFEAKKVKPFLDNLKKVDNALQKMNKALKASTDLFSLMEKESKKLGRGLITLNNKFNTSTETLEDLNEAQKTVNKSTRKMQQRFERNQEEIEKLHSTVKKLKRELRSFGGNISKTNDTLGVFKHRADGARGGLSSLNNTLGGVTTKFLNLGRQITTVVAGALAVLGTSTIIAAGKVASLAVSFEDAFAGISKTVDGLADIGGEGFLVLSERGIALRQDLINLSNTVPILFEELAKITELGGQLGLVEGLDEEEVNRVLLSFTKTISNLAVTTDLTSEDAAQSLARFINIFKQDIDDMGQSIADVGNIIVDLGNKSATTESQIVRMATELAGAAKTAGLTMDETLGLAAAFSSIGVQAEAGSSIVGRALLDIQKASFNTSEGFIDNSEAIAETQLKLLDLNADLVRFEAQTGLSGQTLIEQKDAFIAAGGSLEEFGRQLGATEREQLFKTQFKINELTASLNLLKETDKQPFSSNVFNEFLRVTGTTSEEFKELAKTDPALLFTKMMQGINLDGDRAAQTLEALGFNGVRFNKVLLPMSKNVDLLENSLNISSTALEEGTALSVEAEKRYATLASRFVVFRNIIRNTAAQLGSPLLIPIGNILKVGGKLILLVGKRLPEVFSALQKKLKEPLLLIKNFIDTLNIKVDPNQAFDNLLNFIDTFDLTPINNTIMFFTDTLFPAFGEVIDFVNKHWKIFSGILKGISVVLVGGGIITALSGIATVLGTLLSPIGLVIGAIIALTTAWETNFLGIRDFVTPILISLGETVKDTVTVFQESGFEEALLSLGVPQKVIDTGIKFKDFINEIIEKAGLAVTAFQDTGIFGALNALGVPQSVLDTAEKFDTFIDSIINKVSEVVNVFQESGFEDALLSLGIPQSVLDAGKDFKDFIDDIITSIKDFGIAMEGGNFKEILLTLGIPESVIASFNNLITPIRDMLDKELPEFSKAISDLMETIAPAFTTLGQVSLMLGGSLVLLGQALGELGIVFFKFSETNMEEMSPSMGEFFSILISVPINTITNLTEALTNLLKVFSAIGELDVSKFNTAMGDFATNLANLGTLGLFEVDPLIEGVEQGIEENQDTLNTAVGEMAGNLAKAWDAYWEADSPSQVMARKAQDLIAGLVQGFTESEALQEALNIIQENILFGFQLIETHLVETFFPVWEDLNSRFNIFYTETIPNTVAGIRDNLILSKQDLATTNDTLVTPSVETLTNAQNNLNAILNIVDATLQRLNATLKISKDRARSLMGMVKKLTIAYKTLAAAIAAANTAAGSAPPQVAQNAPAGAFQGGGSFIVPTSIPQQFKGPTGGMMIEVHPRELVEIIPADFVRAITEVPRNLQNSIANVSQSPISGSGVTNIVNNQVDNSQKSQTFNLQVTEAVSSNVRDSFSLLQTLA